MAGDDEVDRFLAGGSVAELSLDDALAPVATVVHGDRAGLPPLDGELPPPATDAPGAFALPPGAVLQDLRWRAVDAGWMLERRRLALRDEGRHRLVVEQRLLDAEEVLVRELRERAGAGAPTAVLVLSPGYEVVEPVPDPALLAAVGLSARAGRPCHSPADVLAEEHLGSHPEVRRVRRDPVTEVLEVRCPSGLRLHCALREVPGDDDRPSEVRIVVAAEPPPVGR